MKTNLSNFSMTKKRNNGGKDRKNRGHSTNIRCSNCTRVVPKDKAIRRYNNRYVADYAVVKDLADACAYESYPLPKTYVKLSYCVSCAVHYKLVSQRAKKDRVKRSYKKVEKVLENQHQLI